MKKTYIRSNEKTKISWIDDVKTIKKTIQTEITIKKKCEYFKRYEI